MAHRITIAFALLALTASAALAQDTAPATPPHARPPEAFKFLSAKDVTALTETTVPGPKTAYLGDHENYFVEYAARTDKGNVAEVHTHWTHYINILEGTGTLTYGGTVTNAKETGPGQIRGDAIAGGTSMTVHEGDYVQIPAGLPHLFNAAPGTKLRYIVFNARQ